MMIWATDDYENNGVQIEGLHIEFNMLEYSLNGQLTHRRSASLMFQDTGGFHE
jgi:hypothetical protein